LRRIFSVLAAAALAATIMASLALPAFAQEAPPGNPLKPQPSCKNAVSDVTPGQKDEFIKFLKGTLGVDFGELRSCNLNAAPQGGGPSSP